mmetsp:Transcript_105327/g.293317  ORF Transcript_105327/g.293317 Transcript_105327/m.293317 type:complete len:208 (-) Transcript_105327:477-1100(-)
MAPRCMAPSRTSWRLIGTLASCRSGATSPTGRPRCTSKRPRTCRSSVRATTSCCGTARRGLCSARTGEAPTSWVAGPSLGIATRACTTPATPCWLSTCTRASTRALAIPRSVEIARVSTSRGPPRSTARQRPSWPLTGTLGRCIAGGDAEVDAPAPSLERRMWSSTVLGAPSWPGTGRLDWHSTGGTEQMAATRLPALISTFPASRT